MVSYRGTLLACLLALSTTGALADENGSQTSGLRRWERRVLFRPGPHIFDDGVAAPGAGMGMAGDLFPTGGTVDHLGPLFLARRRSPFGEGRRIEFRGERIEGAPHEITRGAPRVVRTYGGSTSGAFDLLRRVSQIGSAFRMLLRGAWNNLR